MLLPRVGSDAGIVVIFLGIWARQKIFYLLMYVHCSVWYPSGKGPVCKTAIGRFDSYPHLFRIAAGQSFFFGFVLAKPESVYIYGRWFSGGLFLCLSER